MTGAGVLLDCDGHVLTNAHLVVSLFSICKGVRSLKDLSNNESKLVFRAGRVMANFEGANLTMAKVLKVDLINDTALLKIPRNVIKTVNEPLVFTKVVPEPGTPLLLAGHPSGLPLSVRFDHLISASRSLSDFNEDFRPTFPQGHFPGRDAKMLELNTCTG
ncbi:hypothetical protein RHGRI_012283 [Rhododendron griersonianum]|uniref:Uncharacterized protein n=1 Tax=Rhododendron griersonianum TaxID=479676 RepID=A0AAV6KRJ2_9ERIC|nr:hypothetical protein RHGRI_012283 [Rhododendron griersonianum]